MGSFTLRRWALVLATFLNASDALQVVGPDAVNYMNKLMRMATAQEPEMVQPDRSWNEGLPKPGGQTAAGSDDLFKAADEATATARVEGSQESRPEGQAQPEPPAPAGEWQGQQAQPEPPAPAGEWQGQQATEAAAFPQAAAQQQNWTQPANQTQNANQTQPAGQNNSQAANATATNQSSPPVVQNLIGEGQHAITGIEYEMSDQVVWSHNHSVPVPPHRILMPEAKMAFCHIPKVASSDFVQLFNKANVNEADDPTLAFEKSSPRDFGISWDIVNKEHGWKFAFFTRDPLERYLSAFGSKCMPGGDGMVEDDGRSCGGSFVTDKDADREELIKVFEERAFNDKKRGMPGDDQHWWPQVEHLKLCGLGKFNVEHMEEADFVGHLSKRNNAYEGVKDMFTHFGVQSAEKDEMIRLYFPDGERAGHRSKTNVDFYRNPEVVAAVRELYDIDYRMLHLKDFLMQEEEDRKFEDQKKGDHSNGHSEEESNDNANGHSEEESNDNSNEEESEEESNESEEERNDKIDNDNANGQSEKQSNGKVVEKSGNAGKSDAELVDAIEASGKSDAELDAEQATDPSVVEVMDDLTEVDAESAPSPKRENEVAVGDEVMKNEVAVGDEVLNDDKLQIESDKEIHPAKP